MNWIVYLTTNKENGKLYMLQTRNGKRTGIASLQIAVDMVKEGLIDEKEALLLLTPNQLDNVLHPTFNESQVKKAKVVASGLPASPGCASGKIVFSAKDAIEAAFINNKKTITTQDLKIVMDNTKAISESLGEKIKKIREQTDKMDIKRANI